MSRASTGARRKIDARNATARRLIERAKEIEKSGNAADRLVARGLYTEARELSIAVIRDLERISPELRQIGKLLRSRR
jgi:hypothetical protein